MVGTSARCRDATLATTSFVRVSTAHSHRARGTHERRVRGHRGRHAVGRDAEPGAAGRGAQPRGARARRASARRVGCFNVFLRALASPRLASPSSRTPSQPTHPLPSSRRRSTTPRARTSRAQSGRSGTWSTWPRTATSSRCVGSRPVHRPSSLSFVPSGSVQKNIQHQSSSDLLRPHDARRDATNPSNPVLTGRRGRGRGRREGRERVQVPQPRDGARRREKGAFLQKLFTLSRFQHLIASPFN